MPLQGEFRQKPENSPIWKARDGSAATRRSLESSATINGVTFLKLKIRFKVKKMYYLKRSMDAKIKLTFGVNNF